MIPKGEREELISHYADLFEITQNPGDLISSYSCAGMKQKLAIIGALIHKPKLMVLDEPFVGLDPKAAHTVKQLMHELCDNGGAIFSPLTYWRLPRSFATKSPSSKTAS